MNDYAQEDYDKMYESLLEIAKEYGPIQAQRKGRIMYMAKLGWGRIPIEKIPDAYSPCPCQSGNKWRFCCKEYNPKLEPYLT